MNKYKNTLCLFLFILAVPSIGFSVNIEKNISESKAIELAEEFIKKNGYTKEAGNTEQISLEGLEWQTETDVILKYRHNTLQPNAYGVSRLGRSRGGQKWAIIFEYVIPNEESGRAVVIECDGSKVHIRHQDFMLGSVGKVL